MKFNSLIFAFLAVLAIIAYPMLTPNSQKIQLKTLSPKVYRSIVPLRADGRYEIKGGELDWKAYNFNGEADITGNGYDGIAKDANIPADFPLNAAKLTIKEFDNLKRGCYALYDLDANTVDEIFVQSGYGSGGLNYIILENKNGKWRVINGFTGGFILHVFELIGKNAQKYSYDYWRITNWHRSGNDLWQRLTAYRYGKYEEVDIQPVPFAMQQLIYEQLKNINAGCDE